MPEVQVKSSEARLLNECEPMEQFSLNLLVTNLLDHIMCVPYPQFSEGGGGEAEFDPAH